jgi:hypothetical protein
MPSLVHTLEAAAAHYTRHLDLTCWPRVNSSPPLPALLLVPTSCRYAPATGGRGYGPSVDDIWQVELWLLMARIEEAVDLPRLHAYVDGTGDRSIRRATLRGQSVRGDAFGLANCKAKLLGTDSVGARFDAYGLSHLGAVLRMELTLPATDDEPATPPEEA